MVETRSMAAVASKRRWVIRIALVAILAVLAYAAMTHRIQFSRAEKAKPEGGFLAPEENFVDQIVSDVRHRL